MDSDAGTTDMSIQITTKKIAPASPHNWSHSQSCSAPRSRIRTNAPLGKRASTPARASSKPPALILEIHNYQSKPPNTLSRITAAPPPPPSFATIAAQPSSLNALNLTPTDLALAAASLALTTAVENHQANSLSLLHVTTGTGAILDSKMGLLRNHNISLMLLVSIHIQKAGGTRLLLKTLYKIARLEKKEARCLFAKEDSVTSAAMETAMAMSSITDPDGFTTVSWRGVSSTSPPKQRPQSRSPPRPSDGIKRVNPFDDKFLTSFPLSVGLAMDPAATVDTANRAKNSNNQKHSSLPFSPVLLSLIPPPVGDGSNPNAYIHDPASCQPTKKSFRGANASSLVTAAFSTSSFASPARISMYTNKRTALASPAKGGAPIPKDVETMSRKSLGAPMEETRKKTESPYAAFDHSFDKQDFLRESKKVAQRLLMDPINKSIDEEENANTAKASTQASCIERHREQFENAA
jgi:hypothetical protein